MSLRRHNRFLPMHALRVSLTLSALFFLVPHIEAKNGQAIIDSAEKTLRSQKEDSFKAATYNFIAKKYLAIDEAEGIRYANMALALAGRINWNDGKATAYNILGICYAQKSDDSSALQYWHKSLALFERSGNKKGILKVVGNIGTAYTGQGAYPEALRYYYKALRYSEDLADKQSIAINEGNIGATYEYLEDYQKAFVYESKALTAYTELSDSLNIANTLGNIGNLYADTKNFGQALEFMKAAATSYAQLGQHGGVLRMTFTIGRTFALRQDYNQGLLNYFTVLDDPEISGFPELEAKALHHVARFLTSLATDSNGILIAQPAVGQLLRVHQISLRRTELLSKAVLYLSKAIAINSELSSIDELKGDYASLSEAQEDLGNFEASLASHKEFTRLADSVSSEQTKLKIAGLEMQRDIELKDKQIMIDKLEVEKKRNERLFFSAGFLLLLIVLGIVVRNIRLASAKELSENKLNALQARMNPHFIFNSLSSIQSLILNDEKEQSMDYLSEFSILMRQILDSSGQSKVSLKTEIDMLRSYVELEHLRFDGFSRNINVASDINEEAIEVPGMVVQPFVENAILHGLITKGKAGRLDITFEKRDKHIICTVEDNGVGRAASAEISAKGTKKRQSHGTSIATNRLTMLNNKKRGLVNTVAYIDKTDSGVAVGTKVIIELPILS